MGNYRKAGEFVASSRRRLEGLADTWLLSHVLDTQARVELARGDGGSAAATAREAMALADRTDNVRARVDALLTLAQALTLLGETDLALEAHRNAGEQAREMGNPELFRRALREWADALAAAGQHEQAFAIMREALATS
jgi:ATP/maltotriose-dependent transcriptional regulator MalT